MTVKERITTIRLTERILRLPDFAERIGVSINNKKRDDIVKNRINERLKT